ncbi:MAG: hypothetical protein HRT66_01635 [Flavobacteriaceae bacterium]|nr:hypothetical protein [Flavobacteriaceae bacterium]
MTRKIVMFFLIIFMISCQDNKWRNVEVISPDNLDTLSIKTIGNKRYIFNGTYDNIPKEHALLDISDVTELGDEIGVCWNKDGYKWKFISFYSEFEYNKLDSTKFYIQNRIKIDNRGIPNNKEYFKEGCVVIYLRGNIIRPQNGAKLIYK